MCCRYYFDDDTRREIEELVRDVDARIQKKTYGEIHPMDLAPVICQENGILRAEEKRWGFSGKSGGNLIINATSEHVLSRPMFSESVKARRCLIPAGRFYEWDHQKQKVTFFLPGKRNMYFAGLYNLIDGEDRFVILTTSANASMEAVHDRMPLILCGEEELWKWMEEGENALLLLKDTPPLLEKEMEYQQLSLF